MNLPTVPISYSPITAYNLVSGYIPYQTIYTPTAISPLQKLLGLLPQSISGILGMISLFIPGLQKILPSNVLQIPTSPYQLINQLRMKQMTEYSTYALAQAMEADRRLLSQQFAKYWGKGKETPTTRMLGEVGAWLSALGILDLVPGTSHVKAAMMAYDVARSYIRPGAFFAGAPLKEMLNLQQQLYAALRKEYETGRFTISAGLDKETLSLMVKELSARGIFAGAYTPTGINAQQVIKTIGDWAHVFKALSDVFKSRNFNELFKYMQELTAGQFTMFNPEELRRRISQIGFLAATTGIRTGYIASFISAINRTYQPYGYAQAGLLLAPTALLTAHIMHARGLGGRLLAPTQLAGLTVEAQMRALTSPVVTHDKYLKLAAYTEIMAPDLKDDVERMVREEDPTKKQNLYTQILDKLKAKGLTQEEIDKGLTDINTQLVKDYIQKHPELAQKYIQQRILRSLSPGTRRAFTIFDQLIKSKDAVTQAQAIQAVVSSKTLDEAYTHLQDLGFELDDKNKAAIRELFRVARTGRRSESLLAIFGARHSAITQELDKRLEPLRKVWEDVAAEYQMEGSPIAVSAKLLLDLGEGNLKQFFLRMLGYDSRESFKKHITDVVDNYKLTKAQKQQAVKTLMDFYDNLGFTNLSKQDLKDLQEYKHLMMKQARGKKIDMERFKALTRRIFGRHKGALELINLVEKHPDIIPWLSKPAALIGAIKIALKKEGKEFKAEEWGIEGEKITDTTKFLSKFATMGEQLYPTMSEYLKEEEEEKPKKEVKKQEEKQAQVALPEKVKIQGKLTIDEEKKHGWLEGFMHWRL